MMADGVYKLVQAYTEKIGLTGIERLGVHTLRVTAAPNALDHQADIAKVQEWLGHANIATTRLYDRRKHRPEDSPTCDDLLAVVKSEGKASQDTLTNQGLVT